MPVMYKLYLVTNYYCSFIKFCNTEIMLPVEYLHISIELINTKAKLNSSNDIGCVCAHYTRVHIKMSNMKPN